MRAALVVAMVLTASAGSAFSARAEEPALDAVARAAGFSGIIGLRRDGAAAHLAAYGRPDVDGGAAADRVVRWASVTKMVTAVLVMQEVDSGRMTLDAPISLYLPEWDANSDATIRQLLSHRSGLANPEALPDTDGDGIMDVYQGGGLDGPAVCGAEPAGLAGSPFNYNNCDYIVLGMALEAVTGLPWGELVRTRIREPLGLVALAPAAPGTRIEAWDGPVAEPRVDLSSYGPSADLYGTVGDMLALDQAFIDGRLVSDASRAAMMVADPQSNYGGLSIWSYRVALPACDRTVQVVERQGAVSGVQVRNLMIVDLNLALAVWTSDARTDFGQPWAGKGLTVDLLAAAVCGAVPSAA